MSAVEPDNEEILDEEIVEIFIEEAGEVLEDIANVFPLWAANPDDTDGALRDLRRAFHTLKGSGRMVKANVIGELAWSIENMLNRVLDGKLPITSKMVSTVEHAWQMVPDLVEAFKNQQPVSMTGNALAQLIAQANALSKGEEPVPASAAATSATTTATTDEQAVSDEEMKQLNSRIDTLQTQLAALVESVQTIQHQVTDTQQQLTGFQDNQSEAIQQNALDTLEQRIETTHKDIQDLKYFIKTNGDKSVTDGRDLKNELTNRVKEARLALDNAQQELRGEMQNIKQDSGNIRSTIIGWAIGSAVVCSGLLALGLFLISQA